MWMRYSLLVVGEKLKMLAGSKEYLYTKSIDLECKTLRRMLFARRAFVGS